MGEAMQIDLLSTSSFDGGQPHDQFRWLRENEPVYRHEEPDGPGFWALTRHGDVRSVSRDWGGFSNEPTAMLQDPPPEASAVFGDAKMMLYADPPHHTELRRLVSREFTPRAARKLGERIRFLATEIVDAVIERGECDLVSDIAGELPSYVIAELLGLPRDDGRKLYGLTETLHSAPDSLAPGEQAAAIAQMFQYSFGVLQEKRASPGDDLASRLIASEIEGRRLSDMEFHLFFVLLVDAGGDTTRNLVAGGMNALLDRPELLARLRAEPELLPTAREELLRWTSPVVHMRRTATHDVEIRERKIAAGEKVVLFYGAANRDPGVFERADELVLDRRPNDHVAFGAPGTHFCLGAQIARVEIDAVLAEIFSRVHDIERAGDTEWLASSFISGPRRMPVRFRPGGRASR